MSVIFLTNGWKDFSAGGELISSDSGNVGVDDN